MFLLLPNFVTLNSKCFKFSIFKDSLTLTSIGYQVCFHVKLPSICVKVKFLSRKMHIFSDYITV